MATATPFPHVTPTGEQPSTRPARSASWKAYLLRAALTIAIGVAAVLFPLSALFAFTLVFAAFAFVDGLASLARGTKRAWRTENGWWTAMLRGVVGTALGAAFLAMPLVATFTYSVLALGVLAGWVTVTGIAEISAALKHRREIRGEWLVVASGGLSVLLGAAIPVVLFLEPASFVSLGWVIGTYALFAGSALLWKALSLRRALRSACQ